MSTAASLTPACERASFPRAMRLSAPVYQQVFAHQQSFPGRYLILWVGPAGPAPHAQLGVVTSRHTLHTAVARNRARRLMREAFRLSQHRLKPGTRVVLVARKRMEQDGTTPNVARDFDILCRRAGIQG